MYSLSYLNNLFNLNYNISCHSGAETDLEVYNYQNACSEIKVHLNMNLPKLSELKHGKSL